MSDLGDEASEHEEAEDEQDGDEHWQDEGLEEEGEEEEPAVDEVVEPEAEHEAAPEQSKTQATETAIPTAGWQAALGTLPSAAGEEMDDASLEVGTGIPQINSRRHRSATAKPHVIDCVGPSCSNISGFLP